MSERLAGKVTLVTGSTSGIGKATARLFASEGAKVVVTGRRRELGETVVAEIKGAGGEASYFGADLSEPQVVRDLVRFTTDRYGRLDVLMNNAALVGTKGSVMEISEADWDRSMTLTLKAAFIACQEAIPWMIRAGGGSIINVSSVQGILPLNSRVAYGTAKAGLINMTRSTALDFGRHGIRANTICPGLIEVEAAQERFRRDPELERQAPIVYPLGRVGRPTEVAYAALFLASDESSFVTGSTLVVDGGMTCQLPEALYPAFNAYFRSPEARVDS